MNAICCPEPLSIAEAMERLPIPAVLVWGESHWGQGGLETGDYMLSTFRAHVHLSHNVTGG